MSAAETPATHSVEQHLNLDPAAYDAEIRRLVWLYDELLAEGVLLLSRLVAPTAQVLDLGGGTGSLSEAILTALPEVRVTLLDVDPAMLARAQTRLAKFATRVTFHLSDFAAALPECDAVVASLALHHLREPASKTAVYAAIHARLPSGGVFLNLDASVAVEPILAELTYSRWAEAMGAHGIDEATARGHFADWAHEDRYFSIFEELTFLSQAGFAAPECFWRRGPQSIVGGRKG